jgi:hypothetical protein
VKHLASFRGAAVEPSLVFSLCKKVVYVSFSKGFECYINPPFNGLMGGGGWSPLKLYVHSCKGILKKPIKRKFF